MRSLAAIGSLLAPLLVAGCMAPPGEAPYVAQPKSSPVKNFTSFSQSLRCMDGLLAQYDRRDIVITSAGVPDETQAISAGTKDMLISAISRMSVQSNAFTFVDFDQSQVDVHDLQSLVGFTDQFLVPNYYIRGAITQLDQGVIDESESASVGIRELQVGGARDQTVSVVSLDLNVGNLVTRQIIPGVSANNSIAVRRYGRAADLVGEVDSLGVAFNIALNEGEGVHQAVRTLVELSTIEVLGKLAQVPYWRCLAVPQTNPEVIEEVRGWYDDMDQKERVVFVQRALASKGYYDGPVIGVRDQATSNAIARYQADQGLIASGRVDYDLYAQLIDDDLALGRHPDPNASKLAEEVASVRPNPLRLTLATPRGNAPTFGPGDELDLTVVASRDAFLYCYYEDAVGNVARVFPNQFQPDAYVAGGRTVRVPGAAGFDIVFEQPGAEERVTCLASPSEIGLRLPARLKVADLRPLPVDSLDEVVAAFEDLGGTQVAQAQLDVKVAP